MYYFSSCLLLLKHKAQFLTSQLTGYSYVVLTVCLRMFPYCANCSRMYEAEAGGKLPNTKHTHKVHIFVFSVYYGVLVVYLAVQIPKHCDPSLVQLILRRQRLSLTVERIHLSRRHAQLLHTWRQRQVNTGGGTADHSTQS